MRWIKSFEGRYAVTSDGNIFSFISRKNLKPRPLKKGYLRVNLVDCSGTIHDFLIHRLVCAVFHGQKEGMDVNHKDANKQNNRPENLEWCDRKANMAHASRMGLLSKQSERMVNLNKARCSVPVIARDAGGQIIHIFSSMSEASNSGFQPSKISLCIQRKRKSHGGLLWEKL